VQLKNIGQLIGIKTRTLRYVVDHDLVPGLPNNSQGRAVPREFTQEESVLIALAAVLHDYGFRGEAATNIVRKARSQLSDGKGTVCVDFRGDFSVQVRISIGPLLKRLRMGN
jgi:hypothetical protein